jgi:glycosyltransferase involved in cell wall biosynthesis
MVARFSEQKDHETLIRAMAHLKPGAARLNLIGDGERRAPCEQLARDLRVAPHIRFWGDRQDVPELLAGCHVFVLSTNWEGLPISILEALRAGLPVVATAVAGVPELVLEGHTGFLAPRKDPLALARALGVLVENETLRAKLGRKAREHFLVHFTLDEMVRQIRSIYQEALDASRKL